MYDFSSDFLRYQAIDHRWWLFVCENILSRHRQVLGVPPFHGPDTNMAADKFSRWMKQIPKWKGENREIENSLRFMEMIYDSLLSKPEIGFHRDHPSVHHKNIEDTEQIRFLFHSRNREADTLLDEQLVDCSQTYHSLRSAWKAHSSSPLTLYSVFQKKKLIHL